MGQQSPGAAALQDVEDGVQYLARAVQTRTAISFGSGKVGLQAAALGIGEVALVCSSHARYPTEQTPQDPFSDSFLTEFSEVREKIVTNTAIE